MDYDVDIPKVSGVRGLLGNIGRNRKRDAKKTGNRRVRAGIRQALKTLQPVKVRGITAWDVD